MYRGEKDMPDNKLGSQRATQRRIAANEGYQKTWCSKKDAVECNFIYCT